MIVRAFLFPTYNESETIGLILSRLVPQLSEDEVIIVVDDSPESERRNLKKVLKEFGNVVLLEGEIKGGRGFAVLRGMKYILENYPRITHLIESDCDGSHRFEDIQVISMAEASWEFVIGSRYLPESAITGWPRSRRVFSRFLNTFIPRALGLQISDITNGLRRYSRRSAEILVDTKPSTKGFIYLSEQAKVLALRAVPVHEIPIVFTSRIAGQSSVKLRDLLDSLMGLYQIFQKKI